MTAPERVGPILGRAGHLLTQPRRTNSMGMPLSARRFSVDEYHRMAQAGLFDEDDRIELLDGQIVEMSPIGPGHAGCVDVLTRLLSRLVGDRALLRVQNPIRLGRDSETQPDVALLVPRSVAYRTVHPMPVHVLPVYAGADILLQNDRLLWI